MKRNKQRLHTLKEGAEVAGISKRTLERLIEKGDGPPVGHMSQQTRGILVEDLEAWLLSRRKVIAKPSAAEAGGSKCA